ncbi:MAG: trypsin-like peptidase domain-containing protein, partial [Phycisphaerales bacterium]|nr:trypsin-like peptidase domain-containing protein [Phycisphaerales bacterium]
MPSFRDAVASCRESVVGVHCLRHPDGEGDARRDGSGFVIHRDGLVLTNQHIVEGHLAIYVDVPGHGRFLAKVVGEDPITDVAVLRLDAPPAAGLPTLTFGDSDGLQQGDWVLTLGHPFSFSHTVTAGLVSHVARHLTVDSAKVTNGFLQFSAAVNPGSSGGPVLDPEGRVVGVTTRKHATGEGLAFAVPSKRVRWVLARMEQHGGHVPRGYLGVGLAPGTVSGALVRTVEPGGPASLAGLRPGDRVLRFEDRDVASAEQLYDLITNALPGAAVALEVRADADADAEGGLRRLRRLRAVLGTASAQRAATPPPADHPADHPPVELAPPEVSEPDDSTPERTAPQRTASERTAAERTASERTAAPIAERSDPEGQGATTAREASDVGSQRPPSE